MNNLENKKGLIFVTTEYFGSRVYYPESRHEIYLNPEQTQSLIDSNKDDRHIIRIDNGPCDGLSSPIKISFNLTRECNLGCKHCLSSAGKKDDMEMTTVEHFRLIDQMRNSGTFFVTYGGGEPLLHPDLFEILTYAGENHIATSLVTNGILLTESVAEKLNSANLDSITISFDGLKQNHDFIRGKGSFTKTLNGVRTLRGLCKSAKLAIRMTVNSRNIGECETVVRLAEELGMDMVRLTPLLLLGRAVHYPELLLDKAEYIKFLTEMNLTSFRIPIILPNQGDSKKWFVPPENFGCHCGKEACWITQNGDFYPCIFFGPDYNTGNLRDKSYLELWEASKRIASFCGNDTCRTCGLYEKCRGGCRARAFWETSDINAVDPLCPRH